MEFIDEREFIDDGREDVPSPPSGPIRDNSEMLVSARPAPTPYVANASTRPALRSPPPPMDIRPPPCPSSDRLARSVLPSSEPPPARFSEDDASLRPPSGSCESAPPKSSVSSPYCCPYSARRIAAESGRCLKSLGPRFSGGMFSCCCCLISGD